MAENEFETLVCKRVAIASVGLNVLIVINFVHQRCLRNNLWLIVSLI